MRKAIEGWTAKILLILLIGGFAMWGVSGSMLGGANSNTIAQVGETSISIREFLSSYNRNMNEMQQRFGRRLTQEEARLYGVESRTLSTLVSFGVLAEFARVFKYIQRGLVGFRRNGHLRCPTPQGLMGGNAFF